MTSASVSIDDRALQSSLLACALQPDSPAVIALAGVLANACAHRLPSGKWLRGIDSQGFIRLLDTQFPGIRTVYPELVPAAWPDEDEIDIEFRDLHQLLQEAADPADADAVWLASTVATAALFDNHLWEDLRLPNRKALSDLLMTRFAALAQRNTGNMRWKNFLYKQLCERAGMVCRAPSCSACADYSECFGSEEGNEH